MTQLPVPEGGEGSGSSTATFGDGPGLSKAMPANQTDTSAASESGAEVHTKLRSRPRPQKGSGTSSRSPRPARHGSASSSRVSVSPGQGGTQASERRGRSPLEAALSEPASPGRQGISLRRQANGQGGPSGYDGGSPFPQPVTNGSPFVATQLDSPSPSFIATLLYSPSIAPTVARSPFELAPTTVDSPATSIAPLPVQSPFASPKALSPARSPFEAAVSQSPGRALSPVRSPFEAAVSQSPGRVGIDTPAFELRSRMESRQPRSNMDASGSPSKRQLDRTISFFCTTKTGSQRGACRTTFLLPGSRLTLWRSTSFSRNVELTA